MINRKVKLNNGKSIPIIGLGTWMITDEEEVESSITNALKCGYKHIDTAYTYGNEKYIGKVLRKIFDKGDIKRENLFITSKLWCTYHDNPEEGLRITLKDLQLDYVDLYLVHLPVKFKTNEKHESSQDEKGNFVLDTFDCIKLWKDMESLVEKGLTKSIGVANFGKENLQLLLNNCSIKPVINQFELHPYFTQKELVDYCHSNEIQVTSYSSLGGTASNKYNLRNDPDIKKIATRLDKTVAQIILSWLVTRNIIVIPKSVSETHIIQNSKLFLLAEEDCLKIESLNKDFRFIDLPELGPNRFK